MNLKERIEYLKYFIDANRYRLTGNEEVSFNNQLAIMEAFERMEGEPRLCAHGYIHRTCGDCNVQNDQYIFGGYHGR